MLGVFYAFLHFPPRVLLVGDPLKTGEQVSGLLEDAVPQAIKQVLGCLALEESLPFVEGIAGGCALLDELPHCGDELGSVLHRLPNVVGHGGLRPLEFVAEVHDAQPILLGVEDQAREGRSHGENLAPSPVDKD